MAASQQRKYAGVIWDMLGLVLPGEEAQSQRLLEALLGALAFPVNGRCKTLCAQRLTHNERKGATNIIQQLQQCVHAG